MQTPCAFFVENKQTSTRIIIRLQKVSDRPDFLFVKHYCFAKQRDSIIKVNNFLVSKDNIFTSDNVVLEHFDLLEYQDKPIISGKNSTTHPMEEMLFKACHVGFLNSYKHQNFKSCWLWDTFARLHMDRSYPNHRLIEDYCNDSHYIVEDEQRKIKSRHSQLWLVWQNWCDNFLLFEEVAPELVFKSAYDQKLVPF